MKVTNITGTSSYMDIEIDGKKIVRVQGELVQKGFSAYESTMTKWEFPYENEILTEAEKQEIIQQVEMMTKDGPVVIEIY